MFESFCILYRDGAIDGSRQKLSTLYPSLDAAMSAARLIRQNNCEIVEIRGSDGSLLPKSTVEKALLIVTA